MLASFDVIKGHNDTACGGSPQERIKPHALGAEELLATLGYRYLAHYKHAYVNMRPSGIVPGPRFARSYKDYSRARVDPDHYDTETKCSHALPSCLRNCTPCSHALKRKVIAISVLGYHMAQPKTSLQHHFRHRANDNNWARERQKKRSIATNTRNDIKKQSSTSRNHKIARHGEDGESHGVFPP